MRLLKLSFILMLLLLILGCSKDPIQKGDQEFQKGNYANAIRLYQEALKQAPDDASLKEKIAISYFRAGKKIYELRKVIPAFESRLTKGLNYVPETPSANLKQEISKAYFQIAEAYRNAQPENPYQKQQFFQKTLNYLEKALEYDPQNQTAQQMYDKIISDNFQQMLNRGIQYYKNGKSNPDNFLLAEYYLSRALKFKPDNAEAKKYLKLTREQTLSIIDYDQSVPFAITDKLSKKGLLAYYIIVHNNTKNPISVEALNFYLISEDNSEIPGHSSSEFAKPFQKVQLAPDKEGEGVVAFKLPAGAKPVQVLLKLEGEVVGSKHLP